jgi:hypothetical protein
MTRIEQLAQLSVLNELLEQRSQPAEKENR